MELAEAQRRTLAELRDYRILIKLRTGAVVVVSDQKGGHTLVIDRDGRVFSLQEYLFDVGRSE